MNCEDLNAPKIYQNIYRQMGKIL